MLSDCKSDRAGIALEWDAAFRNMNDPSGRAVKGVHEMAY